MHIIGGVLMPNSNNNKVRIQYLPLLADLRNVHSYSWGSAVLAMLYRELFRTTKSDAVDMGGCLVLLQSWALYRMPFLASVSHQPYVFPLVNIRIVPRGSSTTTVWLHPEYPGSANAGGGGSRHQQERETWTALGGYASELCCGMGESDGSKTSDGYLFRFATIVRRFGAYELVADIEPDPQPDPQPDPELDPEPEAKSEQSYSHSANTSYHPDFQSNDYLPGSSSHSHSVDTSYHLDLPGNDYSRARQGEDTITVLHSYWVASTVVWHSSRLKFIDAI
ncbi:hypothetical protein PVK06_006835 [Gossypium arboreum]|uniref:Aminotransferase-like plant mobile domain-containing protein n=1 Tax=Gossypium arboreum TaxID=29729 RepID=A0ABR0QFV2_GOSAR|nr:hypothetical protein PVK06_006835 [Gossypium arboreum]